MLAVDQEWKAWLDENLARHCDPAQLYRTMRANGFAVTTIQQLMGDAYPTGIDSTEPPPPMDYQAVANVLTREGAQPPAQRFDSDLLQLYTIADFLTPEECEQIIVITKTDLLPSTVTHSNGDDAFRTSETCYLDEVRNPLIKTINEKIAQRLGIRPPYSEPIQAQRYSIGQEFKAHHDYFSPYLDVYEKFVGEAGQRTWTFMIYLNDTPKGGGTHFLYPDHTFYPKQGMAVIWNNLYIDGTPNRNTMHHGMPVEAGEKIIITKWFRENGYGPMFYD